METTTLTRSAAIAALTVGSAIALTPAATRSLPTIEAPAIQLSAAGVDLADPAETFYQFLQADISEGIGQFESGTTDLLSGNVPLGLDLVEVGSFNVSVLTVENLIIDLVNNVFNEEPTLASPFTTIATQPADLAAGITAADSELQEGLSALSSSLSELSGGLNPGLADTFSSLDSILLAPDLVIRGAIDGLAGSV